ncbi:hypothetical protein M3147_10945 [Agromyces mediolanus]|uniref:hypothetical protein n=1 Tax=Agromyces mediolanus TaxID=41986 RepID=UPI00204200AA|nr:hypothetical protein [Agromyces mediolanus]MCM3657768.1 hypothetical protein [Agromyces mediolanus]
MPTRDEALAAAADAFLDVLDEIAEERALSDPSGDEPMSPPPSSNPAAQLPTKWMSPQQVVEHVPGLTVRHLEYLRGAKRPPRYYKPTERTVIYNVDDIDEWVRINAIDPARP